jgi:hypothetical protein
MEEKTDITEMESTTPIVEDIDNVCVKKVCKIRPYFESKHRDKCFYCDKILESLKLCGKCHIARFVIENVKQKNGKNIRFIVVSR